MEILPQPLCLTGIVVHGQQLGRRLGFPTANLGVEGLQGPLPSTGVYAGRCILPGGGCFEAMINVGYRPTVAQQEHQLSVEAHLLDFDGDLYGMTLLVEITARIRDEKKMATLDELREQLTADLATIRQNNR